MFNAGSSWTRGLVCRKGKKGTEDATIIQGLKGAGAILIGLTNIPEFCAWIETRNMVFGQTSNPYNTNRTVGGSSGGEVMHRLVPTEVLTREVFPLAYFLVQEVDYESRVVLIYAIFSLALLEVYFSFIFAN